MKKLMYLAALLLPFLIVSCEEDEKPSGESDANISCTTLEASDISLNSAVLNGTVTISDASSKTATAWFLIGTDASTVSKSTSKVAAGTISSEGGNVSGVAEGLSADTRYYFMLVASVDGKLAYGKVSSFVTQPCEKELVATGGTSDVAQTSAKMYGYANIPSDMEGATFGILYSANSSPTRENGTFLEAKTLDGDNRFCCEATGLQPSVKYYYRAFVKYGRSYNFGKVQDFTTSAVEAGISTLAASGIGLFAATLNGSVKINGGELSGDAWFLVSESASTLDALKTSGGKYGAAVGEGGTFSYELSSLKNNTKYYYVACAKVSGRDYYGEVKSFTTKDFKVGIKTGEASDIGLFGVTLAGQLDLENADGLSKDVWLLLSDSAKTLDELKASGTVLPCSPWDDGHFTYVVISLDYATEYYYVACAKVHDREVYGEVKSFSTKDLTVNVSTLAASEVGPFSAVVSGTLESDDSEGLEKSAWFLYSDTASDEAGLKASGIRVEAELDGKAFSATLGSLRHSVKYYYMACAKVYDKEVYGTVSSFETEHRIVPSGSVDLGLSVMWGATNLGASSAEDPGVYFAWGETSAKDEYSWANYIMCKGSYSSLTKYNTESYYGTVDGKTVLDPDDDVAHVLLGDGWHIPTDEEWAELRTSCTWTWTEQDGMAGCKVTGPTGESIFLPATGYRYEGLLYDYGTHGDYWSSSLYTESPENARSLGFSKGEVLNFKYYRFAGFTIRPVAN